jgi:preprotein translocase subunit SecE
MLALSRRRKKPSYWREVQSELKKVSWPSKEELVLSTKAVIVSVFLFGFSVYLVDLGVKEFFGLLARWLLWAVA